MTSVLVVDDDAGIRDMLGRFLRGDGYEVREAANGREAMAAYRLHAADLVITDMYMPDADGIDVIMRLRSEFPDTRIVAMSGGGYLDQGGVLEFAERAGALGMLPKPFDRQSLRNAVMDALGPSRAHPQGSDPTYFPTCSLGSSRYSP